jgi:hypothetical protein
MPEYLIINRFEHDEAMRKRYPEKCKKTYTYSLKTTDEWRKDFYKLSKENRIEIIDIICENQFDDSVISCKNKAIKKVLSYYRILR